MGLSKAAREFFAKEGRKGGKAYAKNTPRDERIAAARKAAQARWARNEKRIDAALKEVNQGTKVLLEKVNARQARSKQKRETT
jgi:hypothetical protein